MAKKKKTSGASSSKLDARGYGQPPRPSRSTTSSSSTTTARHGASTSAAPSASALRVTVATQNRLDNVLLSLEGPNGSASSSLAPASALPLVHPSSASRRVDTNHSTNPRQHEGPSDRFVKRLSNVNDRLLGVNFTPTHIDQVCVALGYGITLESALDWLCLNLPVHELPPLFTAVDDGSNLGTSSSTSLQVIVPVVPQSSSLPLSSSSFLAADGESEAEAKEAVRRPRRSTSPPPLTAEQDSGVGAAAAAAAAAYDEPNDANKAWILQQYQYCDDDGEGDDDDVESEGPDPVGLGESDDPGSGDNFNGLLHPSDPNSAEDGPAERQVECRETAPSELAPSAAAPVVPDGGDGDDIEPAREEEDEDEEHEFEEEGRVDGSTSAPESSAPTTPMLLTDEDRALDLLRHELDEARADVADDASNYLRSKHEIKELRRRVTQLTRRVADAERRYARRRAENSASPPENPLDGDGDDGDGEGGLFDMFNDEKQEGVPSEASRATPPNNPDASKDKEMAATADGPSTIVFPVDALKSWTGKTPRLLLQEHCQKQRWSKPKYTMEGSRCHVTVTTSSDDHREWQAELWGNYRAKYEALMAKEYVATQLLYQMLSDRPLYRVLPPYFSDLWKGWRDAEKHKETLAKEEVTNERTRRIQHVIELIESTANERLANTNSIDTPHVDDAGTDRIVNSTSEARNPPTEAIDDSRLQKMFLERCETPRYQKMIRSRSSLPIFPFRDRIVECVQEHPVTVISAETGAGKSTNCGQFLLEDALQSGRFGSILCTQPRRVAATSVAERVAEEMGEASVGRLVGYQIRLESRKCNDTRLLFCTTGVVLRRLVDDPTLTGVTHVIVDEVHERQWQIDVLLISLRRLLYGPRPDLKVVLMSATLDSKLFCSYFGGAQLVCVPGRTFPVSSYYLEDLLEETGHVIEADSMFDRRGRNAEPGDATIWVSSRGGHKRKENHSLHVEGEVSGDFEGYSLVTQRSMDRVDESIINYDLIEDVLRTVLLGSQDDWKVLQFPPGSSFGRGSVLVFLPGFGEIKTLVERLQGSRDFGGRDDFDIIPMHSSLSSTDQRRAFRILPLTSKVRKIIVATNIAETSVTIPDVTVVIDSGRVRELHHDKRTSTPKLIITWCSKSSTKQRAGRAGRTQAGMCLKLYSSKTEERAMKDISEPELLRIPLEEVCLNILATGLTRSSKAFLRDAPQSPPEGNVTAALDRLQEIGAITVNETYENLTPLGRLLAQLPLDARLGKMLIYGTLFMCVDPISTIAACLSATKSIFVSTLAGALQGSSRRSTFSHPASDFLTLVNVYDAFAKADSSGSARKFCQENSLSFSALQEASKAKAHYVELLCSIGLLDRKEIGIGSTVNRLVGDQLRDCRHNSNWKNEELLHTVILGGVYPNLALVTTKDGGRAHAVPVRLQQKNEQLDVHSSSANHKLPMPLPSRWVAFGEKLGTSGKRITVSTTCFVSEMAILLLANDISIKHLERRVVVDGWMDMVVPARTAVTIQAIRSQLDRLLTCYFESQIVRSGRGAAKSIMLESTVQSIADLICPPKSR